MEPLIARLFLHQWQRKLVALITALVIWLFVNHSIITTKTIPSVPIRVVNIPSDKTIQGLLPNGFLSKRIPLTLSGTKDVIEQLELGDLEILVDMSNRPNEGTIQITKKNLVSLNPNINLLKHVTLIEHPELEIKLSQVATEHLPITVHLTGQAPPGYEFLGHWPVTLMQTVSGPSESISELKDYGLEITFNLDDITQEQLDALQSPHSYEDEVSFPIPESWKKVAIPFSTRGPELLNDPEARHLSFSFLRQQLLPLANEIPLHVFYPLKSSQAINPETYPLVEGPFVKIKENIPILLVRLFAKNVSRLFLEIVRENLELSIIAAPPTEREKLEWGINFMDSAHLEDTYVALLISQLKTSQGQSQHRMKEREDYLRQRFRRYLQNLSLYVSPQHKLEIESSLGDNHITVYVPYASLPNKAASHAR